MFHSYCNVFKPAVEHLGNNLIDLLIGGRRKKGIWQGELRGGKENGILQGNRGREGGRNPEGNIGTQIKTEKR